MSSSTLKFILYAQLGDATLARQLGVADYSYTFLLRAFAEVLPALGEVASCSDWAEVTSLSQHCAQSGQRCLVLAFTPPHKLPLPLPCATLPVFAWEYPQIPERIEENSWQDDPRHDWRYVFALAGRAIGLSQHTAEAVRRSMGHSYPIAAIPAPLPLWLPVKERRPALQSRWLSLHGAVADSWQMGLNADGLTAHADDDGTPFSALDDTLLPSSPEVFASAPSRPPDDTLGTDPCGWDIPASRLVRLPLSGPVFTSVLTPAVGRKNWEDLVLGFCWAFRDRPDATLLLKLTGQDLTRCHHELLMMLSKMSPMRCRVLAIYGYLEQADYAALVEATTFYVNTSRCEGLCLPLVEFLGSGVPAIAPDNTAMADYIDETLAFVVKSYPGVPTVWPHGDHQVNRTSFHQLDWQSLFEAYRASDELARNEPARYLAMSRAARRQMEHYCGRSTVMRQLAEFLGLPLPEQAAASQEAAA